MIGTTYVLNNACHLFSFHLFEVLTYLCRMCLSVFGLWHIMLYKFLSQSCDMHGRHEPQPIGTTPDSAGKLQIVSRTSGRMLSRTRQRAAALTSHSQGTSCQGGPRRWHRDRKGFTKLGRGPRSDPWLRLIQGASCYSIPGQVVSAVLQLQLYHPVAVATFLCSYTSDLAGLEESLI